MVSHSQVPNNEGSAEMDTTCALYDANTKGGRRRADIYLHGVHPFLIWDFFYLVIQLTQMQHILCNLEGVANVMLQRKQVELTSVSCQGSAADSSLW